MDSKPFTLAVVTGILAFLFVGVAVTELTQPWIEFSLFLGIPAGFVAGVFVVVVVYVGLVDEAPARRSQIVAAVTGFGASFLVVLVVLTRMFAFGMVLGSISAVGVGLLVAIVVFIREENRGFKTTPKSRQ